MDLWSDPCKQAMFDPVKFSSRYAAKEYAVKTFAVAKRCCPSGSLPRRMTVASPADSLWHTGRTAVRQILRGPRLQTKLTVGAPDDVYEQEADRVADEMMRMPEPQLQAAPT